MGDAGIALSQAHVRIVSWAASALTVLAACALLVLGSRVSPLTEDDSAQRVSVWLARPEEPRTQPDRRAPQQQRAQGAPSEAAAPDMRPAADRAAMAQMLRCFGVRRESARPADCPREPPPPEWSARAQLPVGGDHYRPPPVNLERVYSRAELNTIVMPQCGPGCFPIGPVPPPPVRSAEQICEEGGLGGPCRPPPEHAPGATE